MASEPPESGLVERVKHKAYPTQNPLTKEQIADMIQIPPR
jgi:hypothetical protein